ncbi:hypothetical protein NDU88_005540 [Pleurodeles waltl]|uniref:Uncharacterized protein n=1 Tax=Pleurodeles waltl TaxID=8319 RepID=A0AAV7PFP9_PLEWA|nr:hypothetical protein NDU88_005540 [Pleurodeles waltl]
MKTALCLILLALPMSALAAPITEECILSKELYEHFKQLSLHGFQVETPSENNDNDNCETDFMDVQDFLSKLKEFISDVQRQFCP